MRLKTYRVYRKMLHSASSLGRYIYKKLSPTEREFTKAFSEIDRIPGHLKSPKQEHWLFKTAHALPDGATIVEIGSYLGRSTASLAWGCRGSHKHIFAVDTFDGNQVDFFERDFYQEFIENLKQINLFQYVTPVRGYSVDVAATWEKPINLLFIDGSHEYKDVLNDFEKFFPYVVSGGIVAFHDVSTEWPGVLDVWNTIAVPQLTELGKCSTLSYGRKKHL